VAVIEGRELLTLRERTEAGAGTCVGRPVTGNTVRIIAISDQPIADWAQVQEVPVGVVGEITVAGPSTTDAYFNRPAQTALAKIRETLPDGSTRIVHRMGDLGYFDHEGRLWFCGRKSQRVVVDATTTLCTEQVEPIFNTHPQVRRTALVGVGTPGAQVPVLVFETVDARVDTDALAAALRHQAEGFVHTARIAHFLHFPKPFPVDIRHNAKIGREVLAAWATRQLARRAR
jgi:acyl-CoA synthetase (AMP-forming)/AMP-acid ligase II